MKKLFFWFLTFLLLSNLVFAQQQQPPVSTPVNPSANFEKVVVKEHFVTKKEVKDHIDKKVLEYQKTTEEQLIRSFDEVKNIVDSKINKFIFKLVVSIFATMFFSGSLWFFVRKRLERKYEKIEELKFESLKKEDKKVDSKLSKSEPMKNISEEEKSVEQPLTEPNLVEKENKGVIYTFKDGEAPKYDKSSPEARELQVEKKRLLKEHEDLESGSRE